MKDLPLVSILMPCYNSEKYLLEAISSIIEQTYSNWELLICNDSSTDNSLSIIKQFESDKIKIFEIPERMCLFLVGKVTYNSYSIVPSGFKKNGYREGNNAARRS